MSDLVLVVVDIMVVVGMVKVEDKGTVEDMETVEDMAMAVGMKEVDMTVVGMRVMGKMAVGKTEVGMATGMVGEDTTDMGMMVEGNIRWLGPGSIHLMEAVRKVVTLRVVRLVGHLQLRFAIVGFVDAYIRRTRFYIYRRPVSAFLKKIKTVFKNV